MSGFPDDDAVAPPAGDQLQGVLDLETEAVAASWPVVDDRLVRWQVEFAGMFGL
jgi:hypothetical protein